MNDWSLVEGEMDVTAIHSDPNSTRVWYAMGGCSIQYIDTSISLDTIVFPSVDSSFSCDNFTSIWEGPDGVVWAGDNLGQLWKYGFPPQ